MAPSTLGPATITTAGIANSAINTYQRKAFYANGRHWAFFVYTVTGTEYMGYSSSVDGTTWAAPTLVRQALEGAEFTVMMQPSGSTYYVHYAYSDALSGGAIYYRRGTLGAGTITWSAEQTAKTAEAGYIFQNLTLCLDSSNFVYIGYVKRKTDDTETTPYVIQSTTSPTWTDGPMNPQQITAVHDASWVLVVAPFSAGGILAIYAANNGNIYHREYSGGMWLAQTDSGFDMGADARRISVTWEMFLGAAPVDVHMVWQDQNENILHASYDLAWHGSNTVYTSTENLAPMLASFWYGDEDTVDHVPNTLYCFWTPITAAPTADWIHYKVSRDAGTTWTDEGGANAVEEWIDETISDFPSYYIGSVSVGALHNNAGTKQYITLVYVNDSGPDVRAAGLEFSDPDEDLLGEFIVRPEANQNLLGEFVVRHEDIGESQVKGLFNVAALNVNLLAYFEVDPPDNANVELAAAFFASPIVNVELLAEMLVRAASSAELLGEFEVRGAGSAELLGEFFVYQVGSPELLGQFIVSTDAWIAQGVSVAIYQALGIVS